MTVFVDVEQLAPSHDPSYVESDPPVAAVVGTNGAASNDSAPMRTILVAEDDVNCRRALRHYLLRSGYQVAEAETAPSSLEVTSQLPADLVILDFDQAGTTAEAEHDPSSQHGPRHRVLGRAASATGSASSTSAPTTSWPSPTPSPSSRRVCVPCSAAAVGHRPRHSTTVSWSSIKGRAGSPSAGPRSR